jgi:hypothetical protein
MTRRSFAVMAGLIAIAACAWPVFVWFATPYIPAVLALNLTTILIGLLIALPLSLFAGSYWNRWLFAVTAFAAAILLFIGLRLH